MYTRNEVWTISTVEGAVPVYTIHSSKEKAIAFLPEFITAYCVWREYENPEQLENKYTTTDSVLVYRAKVKGSNDEYIYITIGRNYIL